MNLRERKERDQRAGEREREREREIKGLVGEIRGLKGGIEGREIVISCFPVEEDGLDSLRVR